MLKQNLYILLATATCLMMFIAVGLVFLYAPTEATMGIVQKIFYFHVPSAYTMYLSWATCTFASVLYLVKRTDHWDMLAKSAAEMALVFAAIVMTTGPLWGRKSWGAYWTWDPRLTSSLLLTLIILSYVLLRAFSSGEVERRFAAALSILGACIIPLIHLSVQKWRGQHPTVITSKGGGLDPTMKIVFAFCMVTFTLFFITLIIRRYKLEKNKRRLDSLREEAATQGLSKGAYR
jgi:heme exporter protein C